MGIMGRTWVIPAETYGPARFSGENRASELARVMVQVPASQVTAGLAAGWRTG